MPSQRNCLKNPAAVIVTEHWLDEVLMQNIALENNTAETAFVKMLDAENYEILGLPQPQK